MSMDEARAEVAKVIERALADLNKAQDEASRRIEAQIRMASLIAETRAITGDPQELGADGSLALKRSELPSASIGDEVIMWLKADTPLGGRRARMECVEMTCDTLTFREVGE